MIQTKQREVVAGLAPLNGERRLACPHCLSGHFTEKWSDTGVLVNHECGDCGLTFSNPREVLATTNQGAAAAIATSGTNGTKPTAPRSCVGNPAESYPTDGVGLALLSIEGR